MCIRDSVYPVVAEDFERISRIAYAEERAFLKTIESGTTRLEHAVDVAKGEKRALSGADAFALHDTFGFPIDLTLEMAGEAGVAVDEKAFRELMAEQRQRAQEDARAKKGAMADLSELRRMLDDHGSEFTGYTEPVSYTHLDVYKRQRLKAQRTLMSGMRLQHLRPAQ